MGYRLYMLCQFQYQRLPLFCFVMSTSTGETLCRGDKRSVSHTTQANAQCLWPIGWRTSLHHCVHSSRRNEVAVYSSLKVPIWGSRNMERKCRNEHRFTYIALKTPPCYLGESFCVSSNVSHKCERLCRPADMWFELHEYDFDVGHVRPS